MNRSQRRALQDLPRSLSTWEVLEAPMPAALAVGQAPGIDGPPALWSLAFRQLVKSSPWEMLSDAVTFRFKGSPALETAVAVLLGKAGEQRGVILYPREQDHLSFKEAAMSEDVAAISECSAVSLYIDPLEELHASEVQACSEAGLIGPEGLCPRLLVLDQGRPRAATPEEQLSMLAVVEAITSLCYGVRVDLELQPAAMHAKTKLGIIEVSSSPDPLYTRHTAPSQDSSGQSDPETP